MPDRLIRQYATFPIDWPSTADEKLNAMQRVIDLLRKEFGEESSPTVGYPTDSWKLCVPGVPGPRSDSAKPSPVAALTFKSTELLDKFREIVGKSEQAQRMRIGPSPGVGLADHWCPLGPDQDTFGTGIDALQQIDAGALKLAKLSGQGVNVVIVDRGLDKTGLPEQNFGGGWCHRPEGSDQWREPGTTTGEDSQHAMMIARNVLAVAPEARLYDLPVIPPRALNIPLFLGTIEAAFRHLLADIPYLTNQPNGWTDRWLLVNAWTVYDCRSEHPQGEYSRGTGADQQFKSMISNLAGKGVDIVFCAGNCGQFGPDGRCGPRDFGPGNSILGASSYPEVLTVGAVRVDGIPLGYSSQGPGQTKLATKKPDLVAPSNFSEPSNAAAKNTGTSAACAVAAGVVAALREKWGPKAVLPERMRQLLTKPTGKGEWNYQTGYGVINARKTLEYMPPVA